MSIDWKKTWANPKNVAMTDAALADKLGTSRQNVSAARKRAGVPASPAGHGGIRRSEEDGATLVLRPSPDQRRRWVREAKKAGLSLRVWAETKLGQ